MQHDKPTNITNPYTGLAYQAYEGGYLFAERRIIEWLRNGCGREWTVVHPKDVADAIERGAHRG